MKKLLNSGAKWIYFSLGIISALIVISSLFFMTQYRFVRVNYTIDTDGNVDYAPSARLNGADQEYLFEFVNDIVEGNYGKDGNANQAQAVIDKNDTLQVLLEKDGEDFANVNWVTRGKGLNKIERYEIKPEVFDSLSKFRNSLDNYNNLILAYGIVSLIVFAALIVLSNHNRRIYYIGNIIGGVFLPIVNIALALVLVIQSFGLMANINDPSNNAIYNIVSVLQNPTIASQNVGLALSEETNLARINNIISSFNINSTTLVMYMIFFALTAAYNVFLIIFAVMKYKATAKERNEVLEKARLAGEQA